MREHAATAPDCSEKLLGKTPGKQLLQAVNNSCRQRGWRGCCAADSFMNSGWRFHISRTENLLFFSNLSVAVRGDLPRPCVANVGLEHIWLVRRDPSDGRFTKWPSVLPSISKHFLWTHSQMDKTTGCRKSSSSFQNVVDILCCYYFVCFSKKKKKDNFI